MSETTIQNILALCESIDDYIAIVEERMSKAGLQPDPLVAESVAKYWTALEKLSAE